MKEASREPIQSLPHDQGLYVRFGQVRDVVAVVRTVRRFSQHPMNELADDVRRGNPILIRMINRLAPWQSESTILGPVREIQKLNVPHQWFLDDEPVEML